jgi:hypothetical protein
MNLIFCRPAGSLIGAKGWLPNEPFDYAWGRFGCNRLTCNACGQLVRTRISSLDPDARHYECACQQYDAYGYHLLGADDGYIHAFVTAWACAGHPEFHLPSVLDGIRITADDRLVTVVTTGLRRPPFVAPEIDHPSFWVERLYRLLQQPDHRRMVGEAVAGALATSDPSSVRSAIDFFIQLPDAPGAEHIAIVAQNERGRLESMVDPTSPRANLYDRILEAVEQRLIVKNAQGLIADTNALTLARQALMDGSGSSGMLYRIAAHDREWFCNQAAYVVRSAPDKLDFVLEALRDFSAAERAPVLRNLQGIDAPTRDAVLQFASTLSEPERSHTLRELSNDLS